MTVKVSVPSSGRTLSAAEVLKLCVKYAGAESPNAAHAASIVLAESSGRTNAVNYNAKDRATGRNYSSKTNVAEATSVDRGIWQINNRWHPEVSDKEAFDPDTATREAFRISHGFRNFSGWSTEGTKRQKDAERAMIAAIAADTMAQIKKDGQSSDLTNAVAKVGGVLYGTGNAAIGGAKGAVKGIDAVGEFATHLGERQTWVRVLEVVGGLAAVLVGVWMLNANLVRASADTIKEARVMTPAGAVKHVAKAAAKGAANAVAG